MLPPHAPTTSTPVATRAVYTARVRAHALQTHWLATALNWSEYGGAPQPYSLHGHGLSRLPLSPAGLDTNAIHPLSDAAHPTAHSAGTPAAHPAAHPQDAAANAVAAEMLWGGYPIAFTDCRRSAGARLLGQTCAETGGLAPLLGAPLNDPRTSLSHLLGALPVTWAHKISTLLARRSLPGAEIEKADQQALRGQRLRRKMARKR